MIPFCAAARSQLTPITTPAPGSKSTSRSRSLSCLASPLATEPNTAIRCALRLRAMARISRVGGATPSGSARHRPRPKVSPQFLVCGQRPRHASRARAGSQQRGQRHGSSRAWFTPWPVCGSIGCAASPSAISSFFPSARTRCRTWLPARGGSYHPAILAREGLFSSSLDL